MSLSSQSNAAQRGAKPALNVAMVGHAFMGRAHGNAYRQANHFFDLPRTVAVLATLLAGALTLFHLGHKSLWLDEGWRTIAHDTAKMWFTVTIVGVVLYIAAVIFWIFL